MSTLYINSQITDAVTQTFGSLYSYPNCKVTTKTSCGLFPRSNSFTEFEDQTESGYKIIALIPGCPKESVSVKYISDENLVKLEAKSEVENFKRNYEASYYVPSKFNLDEMQCSLKNGILTISIPHGKNSKPKEVKIT